MVTLRPENVVKAVDHLGRITLPKGLRDRMYINSDNNELELFTMEVDGKMYICLCSPEPEKGKLHAAAEILKELNLAIPKELQDRLDESK